MKQKFYYLLDESGCVLDENFLKGTGYVECPECPDKAIYKYVNNAWVLDSTQELKRVQEQRAAAYPEIGEQLDAIMKWAFTETEIGLPEELKSLAGQCMAVKAKYPKPEEVTEDGTE